MNVTDLPRKLQKYIAAGDNGCWNWTGANLRGYGLYGLYDRYADGKKQRMWKAHRLTYTLLVNVIPDGLQIDHLCRNTRCVNPQHLEPVTAAENLRRSRAAKTAA